jgi:cytochrome c5
MICQFPQLAVAPRPRTFGGLGIVPLHTSNFYRLAILTLASALSLSFAVLTASSKTSAQSAPAGQDPGSGSGSGSGSASAPAKPAAELPDGDGKAIATEYCQDCHKLTNVVKARKNLDDWRDAVQTMMDRGARLPQDKFEILVQYLVKNFGPETSAPAAGASPAAALPSAPASTATTEAPKPVELPEGDGKSIATEFCQDCHKLTNVVKARKTPDDWRDTLQTMMDRGARLPQDKVEPLVAYLAKNFGPKADAAPPGSSSSEAAPPPSSTSSH